MRRWLPVLGTFVAVSLLACTAALGTAPNEAVAARTTTLLDDSIKSLAQVNSPSDRQRFAAGVWRSADEGCWFCQVGPGTAAAVLWRSKREPHLRDLALSTFDRAIRANLRTDGGFEGEAVDITTMMFGLELATAYLELRPALGTVRAKRWRAAIVGAADYLHGNGNLAWYTNGNINLGNTTLFYLAWKVSGQKRFLSDYETSFAFMLAPPLRWEGFGLKLDRVPKKSDGADGKGYLAESGGATPGFDAEYTHLQADIAARLYVVSHDPRALRLLNLIVNKLLERVDSDWALSTGRRHQAPSRRSKDSLHDPGARRARHVRVPTGSCAASRRSARARRARVSRRPDVQPSEHVPRPWQRSRRHPGVGTWKSVSSAVYGAPYQPNPPASSSR